MRESVKCEQQRLMQCSLAVIVTASILPWTSCHVQTCEQIKGAHSHTHSTRKYWLNPSWNQQKNDKINVIGHTAGGYSGCRPLFASVSFILVHLIITRCVIDWPKISKAHLDNQSAVVVVEPFSWKLTLFTWHTVDYTLLLNYILKSVGKVLEKH